MNSLHVFYKAQSEYFNQKDLEALSVSSFAEMHYEALLLLRDDKAKTVMTNFDGVKRTYHNSDI